jgi:hypothetical protein
MLLTAEQTVYKQANGKSPLYSSRSTTFKMNGSVNASLSMGYGKQIATLVDVIVYLYMPLVASSIFGNVLILVVVVKNKLTTTSVLFGILAGIDLFSTLIAPGWRIMARFSSNVARFTAKEALTLEVLFQASNGVSTWTLVIITMERLLSITIPLKVKLLLTMRLVVLLEIVVSALVIVIQIIRHFFAVELINRDNTKYLSPRSMAWDRFFVISDWTCFLGIPFIFIITASLVIAIKLRSPFGGTQVHSDRFRSVTTNLLMANVTFLCTNIPFRLVNILFYKLDMRLVYLNPLQVATIRYTSVYLMHLNHALNFYVYILSGRKFREDVKALFKKT